MNTAIFRQRLKPLMLPLAMLLGLLLHNWIGYLAPLSPALIFIMLLITFSRLTVADFHIGGFIWWLLAAQVGGAVALYAVLRPLVGEIPAQGVFVCVICPTATAAPVVTGMLGGSVGRVATYSLVSNLAVALTLPPLLSWMNPVADVSFGATLGRIAQSVLPLIIGPLIVSAAMARTVPRLRAELGRRQDWAFYVWAFSLLIVVGNAVSFVIREPRSEWSHMAALAALSLVACLAQFWIGRRIGRRYGDAISGSQSLGQKNTVLAIWVALSFLNPVVSVAPAAYIVWHNTVNSWQLSRRR
ncbi:MAG: transporter [Muribaculaceae bacterium]|nr:transporter [Muribaculaceae bacterium]